MPGTSAKVAEEEAGPGGGEAPSATTARMPGKRGEMRGDAPCGLSKSPPLKVGKGRNGEGGQTSLQDARRACVGGGVGTHNAAEHCEAKAPVRTTSGPALRWGVSGTRAAGAGSTQLAGGQKPKAAPSPWGFCLSRKEGKSGRVGLMAERGHGLPNHWRGGRAPGLPAEGPRFTPHSTHRAARHRAGQDLSLCLAGDAGSTGPPGGGGGKRSIKGPAGLLACDPVALCLRRARNTQKAQHSPWFPAVELELVPFREAGAHVLRWAGGVGPCHGDCSPQAPHLPHNPSTWCACGVVLDAAW